MEIIRVKVHRFVQPEEVAVEALDFDSMDGDMFIPFKSEDIASVVHVEDICQGPAVLYSVRHRTERADVTRLNDKITNGIIARLKEEFPWYYQ